jgi:Rieske Fe-S protein
MPEDINNPAVDLPESKPVGGVSRRGMLLTLGVALNAVAGALFAVPLVGYVLGPSRRRERQSDLAWMSLGSVDLYPEGETRLATYRNPLVRPWDGDTGTIPCWVRRTAVDRFQVFAINCTHLGCPVRWFPQSGLFLCPCHGGAYYADGGRASGPPPRGLFEYDYRLQAGQLYIKAGQIPTLSSAPSTACTATRERRA